MLHLSHLLVRNLLPPLGVLLEVRPYLLPVPPYGLGQPTGVEYSPIVKDAGTVDTVCRMCPPSPLTPCSPGSLPVYALLHFPGPQKNPGHFHLFCPGILLLTLLLSCYCPCGEPQKLRRSYGDEPRPSSYLQNPQTLDFQGFSLNFWWRRGESNPCPKERLQRFLRAQPVFSFRPQNARRQAFFGLAP